MALFAMTRFMGDDDIVEEDKNVKAATILEKLQAEAKAKQLKQGLQSSPKEVTKSATVVSIHSKEAQKPKSVADVDLAEKSGQKIGRRDFDVSARHKEKSEKKVTDELVSGLENDTGDISKQLKVIDEILRRDKNKRANYTLTEDDSSFVSDNAFKDHHEVEHETDDNRIEDQRDSEDIKIHKHKKKKRSHSITLEEPDYSINVETEKVDQLDVKKKKRKRKHSSENATSILENDSLCDNISDSNKLPGAISEKKKKKHKQLESNDDVKTDSDEEAGEDQSGILDEDLNEAEGETEETSFSKEKPSEIGGFTIIGDWKKSKVEKVKRVLPDWLSNPNVISADLKKNQLPVTDMPGLDKDLVERLLQNNVTHFFPVQMQVIPSLLESITTGFHIGRAGYRPSDICVSAPTGSGKTLAFVLPIVQALRHRVTREVRALALLPVRDLAVQVFKVFQTYTEGSYLKVGLLIGQKPFSIEQQSLVRKRLRGYQSMYDIIVATPGRLVDHINKTEGFHLTHLRFLVIDEADRVMGEIKQDWLLQVESAVFRKNSHRPTPGPLTAASCGNMEMPLQKLLYSATLSSNPEKLQQLNLFQPKLFTSVVTATQNRKQPTQNTENVDETTEVVEEDSTKTEDKLESLVRGEFVGKYTTPTGLSEYYIEARPAEKPLIVLYLLHHLKFRNVLCFTNSLEATHRLFWIIKLIGGIEVKEFSSQRHSNQRDKVLKKFEAGKIDIIICSDVMARGMDIENVKYVVSYDPPPFIKTYVHRIGRTARAGKVGSAITLLQKKEFFHFKKMVRESGKSNIKAMNIMKKSLKALIPPFQEALKQLPDVLKREKQTS